MPRQITKTHVDDLQWLHKNRQRLERILSKEKPAEDLRWLVERRRDIHDLLLKLYEVELHNHVVLERSKPARQAFLLLVGAAFSLWRAAFLADGSRRKISDVLLVSRKFLEKVVKTNTIAFAQELDASIWMGGFYLNSARYRLLRLLEHLRKLSPPTNYRKFEMNLQMMSESGDSDEKDPRLVWDRYFNTTKDAFGYLSKYLRRPGHV